MNEIMARARAVARFLVPHGLAVARRERREQHRWEADIRRGSEETQRRQELLAKMATTPEGFTGYSHEDSMAFLVADRGLDPDQVKHGSIPIDSLNAASLVLREQLPHDRPLVGLHVGNFVGVSLAYFVDVLVSKHAQSVVVSIDPGTTHRSIVRPQEHALALLDRYGFGKSHVFAQGFSVLRSVGHEGFIPEGDYKDLTAHHASEGVLDSLTTAGNTFDVAVMDGNHEGEYLQAEIERLYTLLRRGGILVMDDVEPDGIWVGVFEVFERTKSDGAFEFLEADGRIALFRRT